MTFTRALLVALAGGYLLIVLLAVFVPALFTTADPLLTDVTGRLAPPSTEHPFGTDQSGRDVFARVVHGAAASVGVGLLATVGAVFGGLIAGPLIAVAPRWVDAAVMRVVDVFLAIPEFLIALVIVAVLGPGSQTLTLAVTLAALPVYIRYARAHTRSIQQEDYVEAARLLGVSRTRVLATHVVPAVFRRLSVLATLGLGTAILAVSGLSFLGLGFTEPTPEWGLILSEGRNVLGTAWWITLFPGLAITFTVLAASYLGRRARIRLEGQGR